MEERSRYPGTFGVAPSDTRSYDCRREQEGAPHPSLAKNLSERITDRTERIGISLTHVGTTQYSLHRAKPTGLRDTQALPLRCHACKPTNAKLSRAARKVVRLAAGRAAYQRGAARTGRSVGEMFLTGPLSISPVHGTRSTLTNQAQVRGIIPQSNFILECSYAEWFGSVFS
jgi:hypothetical protein